MDPALILILGFLLAVVALRTVLSLKKKYRINPDPDEPEAPTGPEPDTPQARLSYGAARYRTRKDREQPK